MNIGEKSEHYLKAFLLKQKDKKLSDTIFGKIVQLSDDDNLSKLSWKNNAEQFLSAYDIPKLVNSLGISKARASSKSDITINRIEYSLKEINGSPPAIVNHTPRHGFEKVCNRLNVSITKLDKIISDYWILRKNGTIKQDTKTLDANCPFKNHKKYLKPIIEYFVFTGTGRGNSRYPADKVLEINFEGLPNEMKIIEKDDYFDEVWNNLVFSIRSKGMPPSYPNGRDANSISIWTKKANGKNKGALHIRVEP